MQKEREINHLRARFTSMTSHEFGNPLTSILLCLEQLNNNNFVENEGKIFVKSATEAAQRMQILVKDIIALGKADSGNFSFKPIQLKLHQFCQELIEELEINRQKRINLLDCSERQSFLLDPKLLHHILSNLLTNALKYSLETEIVELEISSHLDRQQVIFKIKDRGIGIPEEAQKYLCQSFYRADNVGDIAGSGLGLSIVKKSVDLHRGILEIESKQGIGTTMRVILPITDNLD